MYLRICGVMWLPLEITVAAGWAWEIRSWVVVVVVVVVVCVCVGGCCPYRWVSMGINSPFHEISASWCECSLLLCVVKHSVQNGVIMLSGPRVVRHQGGADQGLSPKSFTSLRESIRGCLMGGEPYDHPLCPSLQPCPPSQTPGGLGQRC